MNSTRPNAKRNNKRKFQGVKGESTVEREAQPAALQDEKQNAPKSMNVREYGSNGKKQNMRNLEKRSVKEVQSKLILEEHTKILQKCSRKSVKSSHRKCIIRAANRSEKQEIKCTEARKEQSSEELWIFDKLHLKSKIRTLENCETAWDRSDRECRAHYISFSCQFCQWLLWTSKKANLKRNNDVEYTLACW